MRFWRMSGPPKSGETRYNCQMEDDISAFDDEALRALGIAKRKALADEVAALEADEEDQRKMRDVAALMKSLRRPE
jgi:hypothetical protein